MLRNRKLSRFPGLGKGSAAGIGGLVASTAGLFVSFGRESVLHLHDARSCDRPAWIHRPRTIARICDQRLASPPRSTASEDGRRNTMPVGGPTARVSRGDRLPVDSAGVRITAVTRAHRSRTGSARMWNSPVGQSVARLKSFDKRRREYKRLGWVIRSPEPMSCRCRLQDRANQGIPRDADRAAQCVDFRVPTV